MDAVSIKNKITKVRQEIDYLNNSINEVMNASFYLEEEKEYYVAGIKNKVRKKQEILTRYSNELAEIEKEHNKILLDNLKKAALKSVESLVSKEQLEYLRALLNNATDLNSMKPTLDYINNIVRNDYINKITNIDNYNPNSKYRLLCHSIGATTFDADKDYEGNYISCSVLSNEQNDTYNSNVGLVYPPQSIIAASSNDSATYNHADSNENVLTTQLYPTIQNIDSIISETVNRKKDSNSKEYNEVVVRKTEPIGIFYKGNYDDLDETSKWMVNKLRAKYPNLKVISIPKYTTTVEQSNTSNYVRHPKSDELNELEKRKQIAKQNNDEKAYNLAQQSIIKIIRENRMQISSEQWNSYTTSQKESYIRIKMQESKVLNNRDEFNYWANYLNNLKQRTNVNANDSKPEIATKTTLEELKDSIENSQTLSDSVKNSDDELDLSGFIKQLGTELKQIQNEYHSMLSDEYIDDDELMALQAMVSKVIIDGYTLKSLATNPDDLKIISVIINSLEEEQMKMNQIQNKIEESIKTMK